MTADKSSIQILKIVFYSLEKQFIFSIIKFYNIDLKETYFTVDSVYNKENCDIHYQVQLINKRIQRLPFEIKTYPTNPLISKKISELFTKEVM